LQADGLHDTEQLRVCFARVITRRRLRKGWSQADLAGYCGLERSYVSRLEKAIRTPSLDVVFRFAQAFGVSPQTLVKEINETLSGPDGNR
jgi:transcriptional regulator with XRE-family HTH domain